MKTGIFTFCLLLPVIATGEIYKWVDEKGQTHYGEKPSGSASENIIIPKQHNSRKTPTADEKQRLENVKKWVDARQKEREKEKQQKAELKKNRETKRKKCNELKSEIKDIEEGGIAWYRLDEAGNRQFYSDDEINARKEEMRTILRKNCR